MVQGLNFSDPHVKLLVLQPVKCITVAALKRPLNRTHRRDREMTLSL